MKALIILGHPRDGSFNHAIARTVVHVLKKNRHKIIFHDLYKEKFKPILSCEEISNNNSTIGPVIKKYCREISETEGIIVIHPNWWGQPPAILKGWIDRVFRSGVAYQFNKDDKGGGIPRGLLKAKIALVFNTSDTIEKRDLKIFGDPLENLWKKCIFDFCGVKNFHRKTYRVIATSSLKQRKEWLMDVQEIINKYFPL